MSMSMPIEQTRITDEILAQSYDDFYGGEPAPVSEVTAALYGDH